MEKQLEQSIQRFIAYAQNEKNLQTVNSLFGFTYDACVWNVFHCLFEYGFKDLDYADEIEQIKQKPISDLNLQEICKYITMIYKSESVRLGNIFKYLNNGILLELLLEFTKKYQKRLNTRVGVLLDDILSIRGFEAIVTPANKSLLGGGGVDGAIHNAAGPELLKACQAIGGCEPGRAVITKSYDMRNCQYLIHAVGPLWKGGQNGEDALLKSCYEDILKKSLERGIKTIAMASISTGASCFPAARAAEMSVKTVTDFVKQQPEAFDKLYWVTKNSDVYQAYQNALEERI